jgi:hypothetical protein
MNAQPALDVELELRNLTDLAVKKQATDIKKLTESAMLRVRSEPELTHEHVLRPIVLACASKHAEIILSALAAVQKILPHGVYDEVQLAQIIGALQIQAKTKNETLQLRILQTLSMLTVTKSKVFDFPEDPLVHALNICFQLYAEESAIIHHTAHATIKSIVSLFFERASNLLEEEKTKQENQDVTKFSAFINAKAILNDFALILASEKPLLLNPSSSVNHLIAAEVIDVVIDSHSSLFLSQEQFLSILEENICTVLLKSLRAGVTFPFTLRITRMIITICLIYLKKFPREIELFLSMLFKMTESDFLLWQRVIALEAVKILSENESLILFCFCQKDSSKRVKIFSNLCISLEKNVTLIAWDSMSKEAANILWKFHTHKGRGLDLLHETNPPVVDELYPVSLAIQAFVNLTNVIGSLADRAAKSLPENLSHSPTKYSQSSLDGVDISKVSEMIESVSGPASAALIFIIDRSTDDAHVIFT